MGKQKKVIDTVQIKDIALKIEAIALMTPLKTQKILLDFVENESMPHSKEPKQRGDPSTVIQYVAELQETLARVRNTTNWGNIKAQRMHLTRAEVTLLCKALGISQDAFYGNFENFVVELETACKERDWRYETAESILKKFGPKVQAQASLGYHKPQNAVCRV